MRSPAVIGAMMSGADDLLMTKDKRKSNGRGQQQLVSGGVASMSSKHTEQMNWFVSDGVWLQEGGGEAGAGGRAGSGLRIRQCSKLVLWWPCGKLQHGGSIRLPKLPMQKEYCVDPH